MFVVFLPLRLHTNSVYNFCAFLFYLYRTHTTFIHAHIHAHTFLHLQIDSCSANDNHTPIFLLVATLFFSTNKSYFSTSFGVPCCHIGDSDFFQPMLPQVLGKVVQHAARALPCTVLVHVSCIILLPDIAIGSLLRNFWFEWLHRTSDPLRQIWQSQAGEISFTLFCCPPQPSFLRTDHWNVPSRVCQSEAARPCTCIHTRTHAQHTHTHTHTHIRAHTHTHTHTQTHMHTNTNTHTHTHIHTDAHTDTHTHTHTHTHIHTYIHTHTDRHIHTLTHRCTHTYAHIHTYTRTQAISFWMKHKPKNQHALQSHSAPSPQSPSPLPHHV